MFILWIIFIITELIGGNSLVVYLLYSYVYSDSQTKVFNTLPTLVFMVNQNIFLINPFPIYPSPKPFIQYEE